MKKSLIFYICNVIVLALIMGFFGFAAGIFYIFGQCVGMMYLGEIKQ